jgi:hypothetical protein
MPKERYNEQSKKLWSLMKAAGWTEDRLNALLLKKFSVTHPNALDVTQMRMAINMMKTYANKAEKAAGTKLRHDIMATVASHGHNIDWLHDCMEAWGYGRSLRALKYAETVQVMDSVRSALSDVGCRI